MLEKHCSAFISAANPFQYEQWVDTGGTYDRNGIATAALFDEEIPEKLKKRPPLVLGTTR